MKLPNIGAVWERRHPACSLNHWHSRSRQDACAPRRGGCPNKLRFVATSGDQL